MNIDCKTEKLLVSALSRMKELAAHSNRGAETLREFVAESAEGDIGDEREHEWYVLGVLDALSAALGVSIDELVDYGEPKLALAEPLSPRIKEPS